MEKAPTSLKRQQISGWRENELVTFAFAAIAGAGGLLVYRRVRRPAAERRLSGNGTCAGTSGTKSTRSN